MSSQILGVVLRSKDPAVTVKFYEALKLRSNYHEHGGPMHYELGPNSQGIVIEVYRQSDNFKRDAIMIEVPSIEEALKAIDEFLLTDFIYVVKDSVDMRFVYVCDPDGRHVMIIQKK